MVTCTTNLAPRRSCSAWNDGFLGWSKDGAGRIPRDYAPNRIRSGVRVSASFQKIPRLLRRLASGVWVSATFKFSPLGLFHRFGKNDLYAYVFGLVIWILPHFSSKFPRLIPEPLSLCTESFMLTSAMFLGSVANKQTNKQTPTKQILAGRLRGKISHL